MKNDSVLITGAAGFIGSHTCERMLAEGEFVVGIDNFRTGKIENLKSIMSHPNFQVRYLDCLDELNVDRLFKSFSFKSVIHLAALVSVVESFENPSENFDLNVKAVDVIARACGKHHVEKMVYASSAAVYGDVADYPHPLSPYAVAKSTSETLIKGYAGCYGFKQICLRYFNVYGSRQDPKSPYSGVISIFADKYKAGEQVTVYGDGEQTRDFIHVKDVAEANCVAATEPDIEDGSYDICTGSNISINYLIELFSQRYPSNPKPIYTDARQGDIVHSYGNWSKASDWFTSSIEIEEGINTLIEIK